MAVSQPQSSIRWRGRGAIHDPEHSHDDVADVDGLHPLIKRGSAAPPLLTQFLFCQLSYPPSPNKPAQYSTMDKLSGLASKLGGNKESGSSNQGGSGQKEDYLDKGELTVVFLSRLIFANAFQLLTPARRSSASTCRASRTRRSPMLPASSSRSPRGRF